MATDARITNKVIRMTLPDGSKWHIPVDVIAINRAGVYAHEFNGNLEESLAEDTVSLFAEDDYAITDWAVNNMNWSDVAHVARKVADAPVPDMHGCWMECEKEVINLPEKQLYDKDKEPTAPSVTLAHINALMDGVKVQTHNFPGTTTTSAAVFLANGIYVTTGMSDCVSAANFDAAKGVEVATSNALKLAREKLWELEGYSLKCKLIG